MARFHLDVHNHTCSVFLQTSHSAQVHGANARCQVLSCREHPGRCSGSVLAVLYCIAGCQLYWFSPINTVETLDQYNIITGVGFGGGSICFFTGATLLLARQVRRLSKLLLADLFMSLSNISPKFTGKAYLLHVQELAGHAEVLLMHNQGTIECLLLTKEQH